jgi:hypothetical protein
MVFWRAVTAADFFNVERSRDAAPSGGGGQSYFSISFAGLTYEDLGRFLSLDDPTAVGSERPTVLLTDVAVVDDPGASAPLTFGARYRPPKRDDRYRIARQNRQFQERHPAWTAARGFPRAPDDVLSAHDPRMPDLSHLKLFLLRLADGTYRAGYTNSNALPASLTQFPQLAPLFAPYDRDESAGIIDLRQGRSQSRRGRRARRR